MEILSVVVVVMDVPPLPSACLIAWESDSATLQSSGSGSNSKEIEGVGRYYV